MGAWMSSDVGPATLARALKAVATADAMIDGVPVPTTVFAVRQSVLVRKYYVLLGTESDRARWYTLDPRRGVAALGGVSACDGFEFPKARAPQLETELGKVFQMMPMEACNDYV